MPDIDFIIGEQQDFKIPGYARDFITPDVSKDFTVERQVADNFFDQFRNFMLGFSLRKLRDQYSGFAIRVRRASDNTEQDIGFTGNDLDTTSLSTFCSGTDGFVTTWYDQSGQAFDATQTTNSRQPKIYDSINGITQDTRGNNALEFDAGLLQYFQFPTAVEDKLQSFVLGEIATFPPATLSSAGLWSLGREQIDGTDSTYFPNTSGLIEDNFGSQTKRTGIVPGDDFTDGFLYASTASTRWENRLNDRQLTTFGSNIITYPSTATIGKSFGEYYYDGYLSEFSLFREDKQADYVDIENNLVLQYFNVLLDEDGQPIRDNDGSYIWD